MAENSTQKTALITGANRGIGFAAAQALAQRGWRVLLTSRDKKRGEEAAQAIRAAIPNARVEALPLDLSSLAGVRRFADGFLAVGYPLHALVNNAGVIGSTGPIRFTADGFEEEFGVNHLGHFLLTSLLMPALRASAPARVIVVSSIRHMPGKGGPCANFDFDNLKGEKSYQPRITYNNTKLANVWFAYEFNRRMAGSGVTATPICPGFVPETLGSQQTGAKRFFYNRVLRLVPGARGVQTSGEEIAAYASDPAIHTGAFYASGKEIRSSEASYDEAKAAQLWDLSEKWVGLK